MSELKPTKYKVLRVTQLDTEQFDYQMYEMLKTFLFETLKQKPFTVLFKFQPELSAGLRFILWNFTVNKHNKNIGQEILGTEYRNANGGPMTFKKYIFGVYVVFLKWLLDRQHFVVKAMELVISTRKTVYAEKVINSLQTFGQFLALLNFLQFMKSGDHVNFMERMLGWNHVYTNKPTPRYIDYTYKRREMLWAHITDTILCLIPFINFRKIFNIANKLLLKVRNSSQTHAKEFENEEFVCGVCKELPFNPHHGECDHVYCYYCIQSSLSCAGSFLCSICQFNITQIKPVEIINRGI